MQVIDLLVFCLLVLGSIGLTILLCWTGWYSYVTGYPQGWESRTSSPCGTKMNQPSAHSTNTLTPPPSLDLSRTSRPWGRFKIGKRKSVSTPSLSSHGLEHFGTHSRSSGELSWYGVQPAKSYPISSDDETDASLSEDEYEDFDMDETYNRRESLCFD